MARHCLRLCNRLSSTLRLPSPPKERPPRSVPQHPINQYDFIHLQLLDRCGNVKTLKQIHALLIVHNLLKDESLFTELFRICFDLGVSDYGLWVYNNIEKPPSLSLQNSIIRCLSDHGHYSDLLMLYGESQKSGCGSDNFTFPFVIKASVALSLSRTGKEVHSAVLRTGYGRNTVVLTALVDMYAKTGHMETSRSVFDEISKRDLVSWNALLSGYSMNGQDKEAIEVFRQIRMMGLKPNVSTFFSIILVCTRRGLAIGKLIHGYAVKCGISLDEFFVPAMMSMYAGFEDVSSAKGLFDLLPEKNVVAWNAMISACTQNRKFDEAFEAFWLMRQVNVRPNVVTLVSVLPICANLISIRYGESVHACGIKQGFDHQISIATALVSMYTKFGDLDSAESIFYGMPEKNLLTWNSIISGYVQNGLCDVGLAASREMQLQGVVPDSVSMVSVLSACAQLGDLLLGKSAHAFSIRKGFDSRLNLLNALMAVYSDCDKFSTSLKLFHTMSVRNVISWNTLISACVQKGDSAVVVAFLHQMQQEDVKFDLITMISILPIFCKVEDLVQGMSIHAHAIKVAYNTDVSFVNALTSMYVNCGDLEAGHLLFDNMPLRSVVSWNALMTGYRNHNLFKEVMVLFHQMKLDEKPNSVTLLNILPICETQLQGKSIHGYAVRTGCISETSLLTSLICMYDRFENVNSCCILFYTAHKRNVVVWNAMMSVFVRSKRAENAVISFSEMLGMEIEPDSVTILTLISACVQLGSLDIAKCITAYLIQKGFEMDIFISNALIDMYAKCGNISSAKQVFDGMNEKDCVSWSVMINGYGMHGDGDAALALFSQMKHAGLKPDDVTFIGVLSACSHAGLVDQGRKLFNCMIEEHHILPRIEHYGCMVDLLGRTGHLFEAFDLVMRMPIRPSASMLESLLGACTIHGNIKLGEEVGRLLFELDPENSRSYVILSNLYRVAGRWRDAHRLRSDMVGRGLTKVAGFSTIEVNSS
ncbi:hypothetical protein MRB53_015167 [Persea americana]|uniref:Uncharacterized protein n=1 Tax=Persea americana TaxID=3435 RepID=A0ACC2KD83_PERAE|nr:hypothetical protein MRB53_015167 [Persea americana]